MPPKGMRVFVVAGEASGDALGGQVLAALKERFGQDLVIEGLGGTAMAAQGLKPLFAMSEVAVMGFVEVLRHYRPLMRRLKQLKQAITDFQPHVLLLIDAQGLSYRLGTHFSNADFRLIQLVAPTVWAWKPQRARQVAAYLDHIACLFPFEPAYFQAQGLPATYVGHPALTLRYGIDKAQARHALGLPADQRWAAVLPGSRRAEVHQLAPVFHRVLSQAVAQGHVQGALIPVAGPVGDEVRSWAKGLPLHVKLLESEVERSYLSAADLAVAASGTVSLELSAQGVPTLLAYRFNPLSYLYIRRKLNIRFMGLTNLLAEAEIQKEFKLNEVPESDLVEAFCQLATNLEQQDQVRAQQIKALDRLYIDDGLSFGARVAALV